MVRRRAYGSGVVGTLARPRGVSRDHAAAVLALDLEEGESIDGDVLEWIEGWARLAAWRSAPVPRGAKEAGGVGGGGKAVIFSQVMLYKELAVVSKCISIGNRGAKFSISNP
jgi:hypothetical protein